MSDGPQVLNSLLKDAADALRADWSRLVAIGAKLAKDRESIDQVAHALAMAGKSSEDSIKRKIRAIQHMQDLGYSESEISGMGQTAVLSEYAKTKKAETYEKKTWLKFALPGSQREIVQVEVARICSILNLQTSESFWDWFLGQTTGLSEEELKHSAGGAHAKG
jgi:hypothetical protein